MCFTISEKYPNQLIAKKDINVYKFLIENSCSKIHESPFHSLKWSADKIFKTKQLEVETIYNDIYENYIIEGFHSYSNLKKCKKVKDGLTFKYCDLIKFIIPKGAAYYYNPKDKEYVSDQIIYTGIKVDLYK